jgi:hypothetical protein
MNGNKRLTGELLLLVGLVGLLILIALTILTGTSEAQQPDRLKPWVIVESKKDYGTGHLGLNEYGIKGHTMQGQRWRIFTNSTEDYLAVDTGRVYRCKDGWEQWCPEGQIEAMQALFVPLIQ